MSRSRPDFWDKLAVKIYPRYLYPTQLCLTLSTVNVGMVHKLPEIKPYWKIMDHLYLSKDSTLRFLGLAKKLGFSGDVNPTDSIFELIDSHVDEYKSQGRQVSAGDIVCVTPFDRKFIAAAPAPSGDPASRLYYTAADQ